MAYKDPEKQREYQRRWHARRRKAWFDENGPCVKCGSWDSLELDHVDPKTKISNCIWSWSKERQEEEIKKCQVLCKDCHKKKTAEDYFKNVRHGVTGTMYSNHGCRCSPCSIRETARVREYKVRKKLLKNNIACQ